MNAEDIDKLEAGRELDILIAERIFGWVWVVDTAWNARWLCPPHRYQSANPKWPKWDGSTEVLVRWPQQQEPDESGYLPAYSSDIAAAWEVVEKMKQYGFGFWIAGDECWFQTAFAPIQRTIATSGSLPLAICRAALKAISVHKKLRNRQLTELFYNSLTRRGKAILTQQAIDDLEAQEHGND